MGRLIGMLSAGLAYFAIATVLALLVLLGVAWYAGNLTPQKLARMKAVLHGTDETKGGTTTPVADAEQPSYDEILEKRAIDFRQLELREEVVRQNVAFVDRQRAEITTLQQDFDTSTKAFETQLSELRNQLESTGEENLLLTFESLKALQSKQQIMLMLEHGEMEKVVSLLAAMTINKRAKILAEFKTPEEAIKLAKILELMGEGEPLSGLIDQARTTPEPQSLQR